MTLQMGLLFSAIAFVGTHFQLSHPLRAPLVRAVGEGAFRAIYSLVALVTFGLMIWYYYRIGREPPLPCASAASAPCAWTPSEAEWIIGTLVMWLASILFVGSFIRNPSLVGARRPAGGPTGVFRITRHPMMWSFAIWAAVHFMLLEQPKSLVLDGAIIILALGGAAAQDRKKAEQMGENWHEWTAQTAFIPFTRGLANPGLVALVGGTLLFFAATWVHPIPAGFWRWIV